MKTGLVVAVVLAAATPAFPHRLDEYLEATLLSVGKDRLQAEITLTPGVAVFPLVAAEIDRDADGVISESEQRAYAGRVLGDLSLTLDGRPLTARLRSLRFPSMGEMKEGMGAIRIEFQADLPGGGSRRRLVFENRHQSRIGVYLVNCLVPRDPGIQIVAQNRDYSQSVYQLDYIQTGVHSAWLGGVALLLVARFAFLWRQRARATS